MISPRYTINSPTPKAESVKSNQTEAVNCITKSPSSNESSFVGTEIAFNRHQTYPLRCYESIMPPPPHNMLNTLNNNSINNNNNNTKSYNRNYSWNNQKKSNRDQNKTDRQVTQHCDKETKTTTTTISVKKTSENKSNGKCIYGRNLGSQNNLTFSSPNGGDFTGIYPDHYYPFMTPHYHTTNGFYNNKQRQDRNHRSKRTLTCSPESHQYLVDMLMEKFLSRSKIVEIREEPEKLLSGGEWDSLNKQIWIAYTSNQQTEEIYIKKINLWRYLYTFIRKVFPRYGLFLVGSTMSGFGSNASDVDMCLLVRPSYVDQRSEALNYLEQIQHALNDCEFVDRAELIWAKVPILKFHDAFRDLEVDLNCNNAVGIRNTHLLHCYANMDWRVRPLVLIVKMWANKNNINDAKNMTISSYSLALMVIHYLQCGVAPPVIPCLHGLYPNKFLPDSDIHTIDMQEQLHSFHSDNTQTLGELKLGFLHYYATFNYAVNAISVRLGARIPIDECRMARSHKNDPHQWKHLCIEEPFDLTNTARSVYDPQIFEKIKQVFVHSYNRLHDSRDLNSIFNYDDTEKQS